MNVRHGALACFRKNRTVARAGSSPARVAGGGSAPSAWATESATKDQDEAVCLTDSPRGLLAAMALLIAASVGAIKLYRARGEPPGHPPEEDGPPSCGCLFGPCHPSASPR